MKGRGRLLVLSSLLLNVTSINALSNNLLKEAFNVTANKYYNLGKYIQYDDTYLNNIKRSQIVGYEYINKNKELVCPPIYLEQKGEVEVEVALQYTTSFSFNILNFLP